MAEQRLAFPLPDGYTELERVVIYKALDEEGNLCILHSATPGLRSWEALGMTIYTADTLRAALQNDRDD